MTKFTEGDIVTFTDSPLGWGITARVEGNRHSSVAPYIVRILETPHSFYRVGKIIYRSGRGMELKEMQGKKKVWCCTPGCSTSSFESSGTLQWQCVAHCSKEYRQNNPSLEEKLDLLLEHLGLEVITEPRRTVIVERVKGA